jgi:peptide/nickel transport system permease protein
MKYLLAANAAIGSIIIGALVIVALTGAVWTPYDPLGISLS